jgi:hypothetical protein
MSHVPLWEAIREQAPAWAAMPAFGRFAAQLPRNAPQRQSGLPGLLQAVEAAVDRVSGQPLRLGSSIAGLIGWLQGLDPDSHPDSLGRTWTSWLDDARRVDSAHRDTVAWLRSRMPGYPSLPAPQLAPGTPLTTVEFTSRLAWIPGERQRGMQFQPAPPSAAAALQATGQQQRRLDETARALAIAMENSEEWARLAAATEALDRGARSSLQHARAQLHQRLAADAVDAYEPRLAMRRDEYRQTALSEEINALTAPAREYADAFDAADQLVETIASDVFGQLATYGEPATIRRPRDLDIQPSRPRVISFTHTDAGWPELGMIVWIDDPLIPDTVLITGFTVNLDATTGEAIRLVGSVLAGTAAAWRRMS